MRSALIAVLALPAAAGGQEWTIESWTVAGGGEVLAAGGEWQASGTLGQPGSSDLAGGAWEASAGFWGATVTETEVLFRDDFDA